MSRLHILAEIESYANGEKGKFVYTATVNVPVILVKIISLTESDKVVNCLNVILQSTYVLPE